MGKMVGIAFPSGTPPVQKPSKQADEHKTVKEGMKNGGKKDKP